MKVLFVASECAPFVKTGGLADVIGAVPKTLGTQGVSVKVMLPLYPALRAVAETGAPVMQVDALHGGPVTVIAATAEGLDLLLVDAPHLFDRAGNIYLDDTGKDWPDNYLRYGALSRIAAQVGLGGVQGWSPDIVHVHDWQAGLVPAYLYQAAVMDPDRRIPATVLTIHNIAFQGLTDAAHCDELGIDPGTFTPDGAEYFGHLGFLKAGIAYCDRITTVSPTYASELMHPEFGMGLEGILSARRADLSGILNGIDTDIWNPETDPALPAPYTARSLTRKKTNRAEIEKRFDLYADTEGPLFCVVSRLTTQKGLDLLLETLPRLVARGAKLALLGSGDKGMESAYVGAAHRYAGSVGVIIGYDEPLSHLMQGGSDAILIPSRFEPCGLTQLYGLRYGTLPVVARTGGLADTVIDANAAAISADCATGIQFAPVTAHALAEAIDRTCDLYARPDLWKGMMRRAMQHPVAWDRSAEAYRDLYSGLCEDDGR